MNRSLILSSIRQNLRETTASAWTDAYLQSIIDQVLSEVANKQPMYKTACLGITEFTNDVDISGLTNLVKMMRVEYPVSSGGNPPVWRNYTESDGILTLDLSGIPTITDGTLTGTITFTKGSRTVAGSSSLFTTELKSNSSDGNGHLICVSSGSKYYQVAHCASATSLTLATPFEEETVTDTVSVTKYRDYKACVRVHYGKEYILTHTPAVFTGSGLDDATVDSDAYTGTGALNYIVKIYAEGTPDTFKFSSDGGTTYGSATNCSTTATVLSNNVSILWAANTGHTATDQWAFTAKPSDVPRNIEQTVILGSVAHAATEYGANYAQLKLTGVTSLLSDASLALSDTAKADAQIILGVADIASGRGNLAALLTAFDTAIADAEGILDTAHTDMDTATTVVDTYNPGGDIAGKYVAISQTNISNAQAKVEAAKSYLDKAKTNSEYLETAAQEFAAANAYIAEATSYVQQAEQSINVSGMVRRYQDWATMKYQEYQVALNRLGRFSDGISYPGLRAI